MNHVEASQTLHKGIAGSHPVSRANRGLSARDVLLNWRDCIHELGPDEFRRLEEAFFNRLKLTNGTYKTTAAERLEDVDLAFSHVLAAQSVRELDVLDVATSSGAAAVRWLDRLRSDGISVRMTISDLTMFVRFVTPLRWLTVLVDRQNDPLEFEIFGRSIRARVKKIDLVTGLAIPILVARAMYRLFAEFSERDLSLCEDVRSAAADRQPLVCSDVRLRPEIACLEDDITSLRPDKLTEKFDVIRAANILQPVYFDAPTIERALMRLKDRLKGDGSWLIVCRTLEGGDNHASIFRLEGHRFVVRSRVGRGSEIERLVLAA